MKDHKLMRLAPTLFALLLTPIGAAAQSGFITPDGKSRYPGVTIFCPSGTGVTPCSFGGGGGGGGGAVSINLGGSGVGLTNRFPVTDPALDALIAGGALTVGLAGTPAVSLGAGSNMVGTVGVANFPATQAVSGSVAVSALPALAAGANAIGSVGVSNFPATQAVSGAVAVSALPALATGANAIGTVGVSNFPATQAVSGAVAVSALPALAAGGNAIGTVGVSNFPATQAVSGAVAVSALPPLAAGGNAIGTVGVSNFPAIQAVGGVVGVNALPPLPAGGNAIGSVGVTALPPLPAGTNMVGSVGLNAGSVGSVTAAGSGGSLAQALQGIAGGVPVAVSGSFWQASQPVTATAWPLPSGAASAAAQTSVESAPGAAAGVAVTVQGAASGVALPVACTSGCGGGGGNAAVGATGVAAPAAGDQIAVPNGAGVLTAPVLNADGGLPAHVSNFPAMQAVSGVFWPAVQPVSASAWPLPAGAATAVGQAAALGPVAPGAATASASSVIGCVANTVLPAFTAGQQGAVPCDTSGRLYVVTVPSAANVPSYLQAVTGGGASVAAAVNAAASCMATSVKGVSGMVFGYSVSNSNAAGVWLRLFATGVAPVCGAGTPAKRIFVPAGGTVGLSTDLGWVFPGGIGFDVTSGNGGDTDSTVVANASTVLVNIDYK